MDHGDRLAAAADVPTDGTLLVTVRRTDGDEGAGEEDANENADVDRDAGADPDPDPDPDEEEVVLVRLGDGSVAAYVNRCQHFRHIRLDKGSGAEVRDGELVCTNHGAYFRADTGRCTYGPCEGAYLEAVAVAVDGDGGVYLTDDDYEFVRTGGLGDDAVGTSRSNVEF
jgi:nitrite reductase/ring-hydroxylating ferredoxin subunit